MIEQLHRLPQTVRSLRAMHRLEASDEWSGELLRAYQRERLLAIIRHAAARSPYYRERFEGIELSDDLDLAALPRIDKATMLDNFDELVTDRRLTRAGLERHVTEIASGDSRGDPLLFGEYRVVVSGGTTGQQGIFVYNRADWVETVACVALSWSGFFGFPPRLPRRRMVALTADNHLHMGGRWNRSLDVGLHRLMRLDARTPIGDLVEALNSFQPDGINTYASIAALLAERQITGELRIAPQVLGVSGEVLTAEMRERIVAAWGRRPFDYYGASETGLIATECERHAGLHVFESQVVLEIVDDDYRPVPPGEPGSRLLVTNLFNRTQPLIRYELNDLVTVSPGPCPCGRPSSLLKTVEGRSDDVLELPSTEGGTTKVHPAALRSPLAGVGALSEYRIIYAAGELRVQAVLDGSYGRASQEIEAKLGAALAEQGAQVASIRVESVGKIPRHPHSGKHKVIEVQRRTI